MKEPGKILISKLRNFIIFQLKLHPKYHERFTKHFVTQDKTFKTRSYLQRRDNNMDEDADNSADNVAT